MGVEDVLTGMSGSRRDQPIEFRESRKEDEAMSEGQPASIVDFRALANPSL